MTKEKLLFGFTKLAAVVVLIPITLGLIKAFASLAVSLYPLDSSEIWFVSGFAVFFLIFLIKSVPGRLYVFGHELTHAIWVILFRGKVSKFNVSSKNGSVVTSKSNFLISLAPYFFPIYTLSIILIFYLAAFFLNISKYIEWLFFFVGFTYSFHIFLTAESLSIGQSDVKKTGRIFSYLVIIILNLVVLAVLLKFITPEKVYLKRYFVESWTDSIKICGFVWKYLTPAFNFCIITAKKLLR